MVNNSTHPRYFMLPFLSEMMKSNPLFAGGISMAIIGWLVVQAKDIPKKLWSALKSQFTTSITVYSEDSAFRNLEMWMSKHPDTRHSRKYSVTHFDHPVTNEREYRLTPGPGLHLLRHDRKFFMISKIVHENQSTQIDFDKTRKQTLVLTILGRNPTPLGKLLDELKDVREDQSTVPVLVWANYEYSRLERRPKRSMDTVYLNRTLKQNLMDDLQGFMDRKAWHMEHAIPYRRGYFFDGPTGTGKTSLIFALASHFNKSVYIINLATIEDDNKLLRAVNEAGSNFVVIEDIDAYKIVENREGEDYKISDNPTGPKTGATFSGLLNALDGIGSREGRILFITSNHKQILDSALLRPGRIDRHFHLGHAGMEEALEMFERIGVSEDREEFIASIENELPLPASEIQNRLIARMIA